MPAALHHHRLTQKEDAGTASKEIAAARHDRTAVGVNLTFLTSFTAGRRYPEYISRSRRGRQGGW